MRISGELVTIPARDIRIGDVVMSGAPTGVAMRYVVGQPYVTDGYVRFPVGTEPSGYALGHWQVSADILSYAVIRGLTTED